MPSVSRRLLIVALLGPTVAAAQTVPARTLSQAEARLDREWSWVASIRELNDGRLIVLDTHENQIILVNTGLTSATQIGREGRGPGEFENPTALLWLRNDSTGVLDGSGRSLKIITPRGVPGGIVYPKGGAPCAAPGDTLRRLTIGQTIDAQGRSYQLGTSVRARPNGTNESTNATAIERWGAGCGRDTVGYIPLKINPDAQMHPGGTLMVPQGNFQVFFGTPLWTVAPDGRVLIVHPDPYRVEMLDAKGVHTPGTPIPYQPIRVSEGHKEAWRKAAQRPSPATKMALFGARSRRMASMPFIEPESWPATLPPFLYGALSIGLDGRLWVQRTTAAAAPPTFDVFDPAGRLAERIVLPPRSRLVSHGRGVVYIVRLDEDDLEYLERHRIGP